MKKFVVRPDLDLYEGIVVKKDTAITYKSDVVDQIIEDLKLVSIITQNKSTDNGINAYESTTNLTIYLNDGDILLFEEGRGYYLPSIPVSDIDTAIEDITTLKNFDK